MQSEARGIRNPSSPVKRFRHCLKANKGREQPRHVLFWDIESWVESPFSEDPHRFRLGWACLRRRRSDGRVSHEWIRLDTPDAFWEALEGFGRKGRPVWCLAHNVAYDLWMVGGLDAIYAHGYEVLSFYQGGPTTILRIKNAKRTILFLDTLNWFPGSLASWGEKMGLPKLDTDHQDPDTEAVSLYCRRDTEIIVGMYEEWIALVEKHDLGGVALSVGGQAFNAFRHKYMEHKIYLHSNEQALQLERDAYFGGRTECWWIGNLPKQPYTVVDVHSMYPYVMQEQEYPCRLAFRYARATVANLVKALPHWGVVATVRVHVDRPVVPIRDTYHTLFPTGEFWTDLTGPDLKQVLKHGEILDVRDVCLYETAPLFAGYVKAFYRLRRQYQKEGKVLWEAIVKKLLNTLYGKWGQKKAVWEKHPNYEGRPSGWDVAYVMGQPGTVYSLCLGPEIFNLVEITESPGSFPAIAAYVTAYARAHLWEFIETAGPAHVYYMDTDSLLVDAKGLANLAGKIHPTRLGAMGIEHQADDCEIRCPKDYRIGDRRRIKGLTRNARQVTATDWDDLQWPKLRGLIGAGRTTGFANRIIRKQLRRKYEKGDVSASGRVTPFVLAEGVTRQADLPW